MYFVTFGAGTAPKLGTTRLNYLKLLRQRHQDCATEQT